ncbi:MAG: urate hydroxylase PuuD [Bdellovibrionales bacterium]
MGTSVDLWIEYLLRFSHLVAGIAWIGSSFYFIWLDSSFLPPEKPRKNVEGELYMVHGGFYYQVEKRKIYPGELPKILHWFKWEATLTWVTGFLLLIFLYYLRGASLLIDHQVHPWTQGQAVALSLAIIAGSWLMYDFIWNERFMKSKAVSVVLSIFFFAGMIFLNTSLFSGRGAFIQVGAIFGSMMLLNVWVRILPGQSKMIKEAQAGQVPDYSVSLKSKTRSVHNTYFTFPVLFIMLSNHYPSIYNHTHNWLLLILLTISGACTRHAMVTKNPVERWVLFPAAMGLAALVWMTGAPALSKTSAASITFEQIRPIIETRCLSCHSQHPTDDIFKVTPKSVVLETEQQVRSVADKIYQQVVVGKIMPLGNKTQMTDEERARFHQWLNQEFKFQ